MSMNMDTDVNVIGQAAEENGGSTPDPVKVYIKVFAALVEAWKAVPENERFGLRPPPTVADSNSEAGL